jgi:hypothetical protein
MKLQSFQQMLLEYEVTQLEANYENERKEMLISYPISVILEGGYLELDNLNKWIAINIGPDSIRWLFYGKTGYDYGFAEYFFADEVRAKKVATVVPHIYTIYPKSYPPNLTVKSNGYEEQIAYDPQDKNAIVFEPGGNEE